MTNKNLRFDSSDEDLQQSNRIGFNRHCGFENEKSISTPTAFSHREWLQEQDGVDRDDVNVYNNEAHLSRFRLTSGRMLFAIHILYTILLSASSLNTYNSSEIKIGAESNDSISIKNDNQNRQVCLRNRTPAGLSINDYSMKKYKLELIIICNMTLEGGYITLEQLLKNESRQDRAIVFEDRHKYKRKSFEELRSRMPISYEGVSKTQTAVGWVIMANETTVLVIETTNKFFYWGYFQHASSIVIFLLIVFGNGSILYRLRTCRRRRSNVNYFIVQLAIADLLVGFFNVTLDSILRIQVSFNYGIWICRASKYISSLFIYASTNLLVALSIDRWEAVVKPLAFVRHRSRGFHLAAGAWIVAAISAAPVGYYTSLEKIAKTSQCWILLDELGWKLYTVYLSLLVLVLPTIIIAVCYIHIVYTIWSKAQLLSKQQKLHSELQKQWVGSDLKQEAMVEDSTDLATMERDSTSDSDNKTLCGRRKIVSLELGRKLAEQTVNEEQIDELSSSSGNSSSGGGGDGDDIDSDNHQLPTLQLNGLTTSSPSANKANVKRLQIGAGEQLLKVSPSTNSNGDNKTTDRDIEIEARNNGTTDCATDDKTSISATIAANNTSTSGPTTRPADKRGLSLASAPNANKHISGRQKTSPTAGIGTRRKSVASEGSIKASEPTADYQLSNDIESAAATAAATTTHPSELGRENNEYEQLTTETSEQQTKTGSMEESQYVTQQHGSGVIPKARIKTIKMTLVIVVAYILCWSPFCILNLCSVFELIEKNSAVTVALLTLSQSLAHLNSAVNPYIYWMFSVGRSSNNNNNHKLAYKTIRPGVSSSKSQSAALPSSSSLS